jgi:hypothetical protein
MSVAHDMLPTSDVEITTRGRWMAKDAFFNLPDWRERCQEVCDSHGFGTFDQLDATRRAEVVGIARNVAGDVLPQGAANSHRSRRDDEDGGHLPRQRLRR